MSDKKIKDIDGNEIVTDKSPDDISFIPHPNNIFAKKIDNRKTKSGIILPESSGKGSTPIVQILAIGSNVKEQFTEDDEPFIEVGDFVYADPRFMMIAIIDDVPGVMLTGDAIFGKIPHKTDGTIVSE